MVLKTKLYIYFLIESNRIFNLGDHNHMQSKLLTTHFSIANFLQKYVIENNELYKICSDHFGCGPLDGVCFEFAKALKPFIPRTTIYSVYDIFKVEHHFVLGVRFEDILYMIDADGISLPNILLARWVHEEGLDQPYIGITHSIIKDIIPKDDDLDGFDPSKDLINKLFSYFYKSLYS